VETRTEHRRQLPSGQVGKRRSLLPSRPRKPSLRTAAFWTNFAGGWGEGCENAPHHGTDRIEQGTLEAGETETFGRTSGSERCGRHGSQPALEEEQGGLGANGEQVLLRIEQKSCEGRRRPGGFAVRERQGQRHLQVAHVADLTCLHCAEKDAELERKAEIIEALQRELNKSMENEASWREAAKAAGKATVAAKGERTKQARRQATLEVIDAVVAHWRYHRPRTTKEFGTPGTASFDVIEKAVKLMTPEQTTLGRLAGLRACCEAITGLHMAPWEEYGRWYPKPGGPKRTLRNQIHYALGDEQKIARCRQVVRWAQGDAWRAFDVLGAISNTWDAWHLVVDEELRRRRTGWVEPAEWAHFVDVGGVRTRVSEKANENGES
jgi:hypothetical protein